ncbi:MAG TPA: hypothetical protein VGM25_08375 [Caulobacteraceae bacterium]|jgi:hypothetical protein
MLWAKWSNVSRNLQNKDALDAAIRTYDAAVALAVQPGAQRNARSRAITALKEAIERWKTGNPLGGRSPVLAQLADWINVEEQEAMSGAVQRSFGQNLDAAQYIVVNEATTQVQDGANFAWRSRFRMQRAGTGRQRVLRVVVRIDAQPGTARVTDLIKAQWRSKIARDWGGAVLVDTRTDTPWPIEFNLDWTNQAVDQTVTCNRGARDAITNRVSDDGTLNMGDWGDLDGLGGPHDLSAITHEFGHMIGNADEYGDITAFNLRHASIHNWGAPRATAPGHGTMGAPGEPPKARHFFLIGRKFALAEGAQPSDFRVDFDNDRYIVEPG